MLVVIKKIVFLGLGAVCAALIFEGALRLIELTPAWKALPVAEISPYGPDAQSAYTHRPNIHGIWATENRAVISTTDFGIRANGLDDEKISDDNDVIKIGLIGDSVTEALQVSDDQTFSALTEKKLNGEGQKYRIYNLGLAGATPAVEAARASQYAESLNLDYIIVLEDPPSLALTLDKSEGGTLPYYHLLENGKAQVERPYLQSRGYNLRQSKLGDVLYFVLDHSRLMTMVNNRLNRGIFAEFKQEMNAASIPDGDKAVQRDCSTENLQILADLSAPEHDKQMRLLKAFFKDLQDIQAQSGAKIIIALYDTWGDCPVQEAASGYKSISDLARQYNLSFLNLKKSIATRYKKETQLKNLRGFNKSVGVGHLNLKGHEVFSDALVEEIKNIK